MAGSSGSSGTIATTPKGSPESSAEFSVVGDPEMGLSGTGTGSGSCTTGGDGSGVVEIGPAKGGSEGGGSSSASVPSSGANVWSPPS